MLQKKKLRKKMYRNREKEGILPDNSVLKYVW